MYSYSSHYPKEISNQQALDAIFLMPYKTDPFLTMLNLLGKPNFYKLNFLHLLPPSCPEDSFSKERIEMILRIVSAQNPARRFPSQTKNMDWTRSVKTSVCMLREEPDKNTDQYYKNMIKDHPGNALLLGNYARFLKEVRGDFAEAEEFCERAILEKAVDANVLSLYGELIWKLNKDDTRAEIYFRQAVLSQPNDSYILASYARFLWDAEENDEIETCQSQPH